MKPFSAFIREQYDYDIDVIEYGFVSPTGVLIRDEEEDEHHSDIVWRLGGSSIEDFLKKGYVRYIIERDHKLCISFIDSPVVIKHVLAFVKSHPKVIGVIDYDIYYTSNHDMEVPDVIGTVKDARDLARILRSRI